MSLKFRLIKSNLNSLIKERKSRTCEFRIFNISPSQHNIRRFIYRESFIKEGRNKNNNPVEEIVLKEM